jgi:hypothetical protein
MQLSRWRTTATLIAAALAATVAILLQAAPSYGGAPTAPHSTATNATAHGRGAGSRKSAAKRSKCTAGGRVAKRARNRSAETRHCSKVPRVDTGSDSTPPTRATAPTATSQSDTSSSLATESATALPSEALAETPTEAGTTEAGSLNAGQATPFRFFESTSFWNEALAENAPLDPTSASAVAAFDEEIAAQEQSGTGPWINTTSYSAPVYTVPKDEPTVPVTLEELEPRLSSAWSEVPLPADAKPAAGTDGILVVWQPSTDQLWEFWRLKHDASGWHAGWGGAIQNVSSASGVYESGAWPGARPTWGASASSLSLVGGLISLEDLEQGKINHALEMAIPTTRASDYSAPAQRSDGKTAGKLSLPEGAHLRLNPNLDLASLHLPRLTLMLAEAAQRYGIFITDTSTASTFYAQDPDPTGSNPYAGSHGYFEGKRPSQLLESFPWSQLELLKMELHTKS